MNWKTFKNKVLENNKGKITFIDRIKSERVYKEVRTLRFFLCGTDTEKVKKVCDKFKGIGFYVTIEKSKHPLDNGTYTLWLEKINFNQKGGNNYLLISGRTAEELYLICLTKMNKIIKCVSKQ